MWLPVINSFSSLTAGIKSAEVPSGKASDETASRDSVDYGYLYAVLRGVFWPIWSNNQSNYISENPSYLLPNHSKKKKKEQYNYHAKEEKRLSRPLRRGQTTWLRPTIKKTASRSLKTPVPVNVLQLRNIFPRHVSGLGVVGWWTKQDYLDSMLPHSILFLFLFLNLFFTVFLTLLDWTSSRYMYDMSSQFGIVILGNKRLTVICLVTKLLDRNMFLK